MSLQPQPDVLVIGGGPTGLTLAAQLARRAVSCRIIDRAPQPSPLSKAIAIQARTLEMFALMGIVDRFSEHGVHARGMNLYADGHRLLHLTFDKLDSPFPYILLLPQSITERILEGHLNELGVTLERKVELTALTQTADAVSARLRHGDGRTEDVTAGMVVGCDGAHSTVRHLLGLSFEGAPIPADFLLADVRLEGPLPQDQFEIYVEASGLLALFPLGDGRFRIIADNPPVPASARQAPTLAECQSLVDLRGPEGIRLIDAVWIDYFRINSRLVSQMREGRVFVAGDSAHVHSPAGGQGMNTGIQDACNLGWKLALVAQGAASPDLLDSYQAERYPVERFLVRSTEALTKLMRVRSPLARTLRDTLAPLVTGQQAVQDWLRSAVTELAIHFRHSPIVEDHLAGGGPAAGDRAPDASIVAAATGNGSTLYEQLTDPRQTLLVLCGDASADTGLEALAHLAADAAARYGRLIVPILVVRGGSDAASLPAGLRLLLDPDGGLHRRFGGHAPGLYVLRPDGYIAFRGPAERADLLHTYITRLFRP